MMYLLSVAHFPKTEDALAPNSLSTSHLFTPPTPAASSFCRVMLQYNVQHSLQPTDHVTRLGTYILYSQTPSANRLIPDPFHHFKSKGMT